MAGVLGIGVIDVLDFLGLTDDWGVFLGGEKAIEFDSFIAIDFRDNSRLSNFPQEEGAFATYNKVETPYDIRLTLTKGGSDADRAKFLTVLYDIKKSIELYDIVTPEITYIGANLETYSVRRSERSGRTLLTADLFFKEVRVAPGTSNYNPTQPGGAAPVSVGQLFGKLESALSSFTQAAGDALSGAIGGVVEDITGNLGSATGTLDSFSGLPGIDSGILGGIV